MTPGIVPARRRARASPSPARLEPGKDREHQVVAKSVELPFTLLEERARRGEDSQSVESGPQDELRVTARFRREDVTKNGFVEKAAE
jgi:hypothetical protein